MGRFAIIGCFKFESQIVAVGLTALKQFREIVFHNLPNNVGTHTAADISSPYQALGTKLLGFLHGEPLAGRTNEGLHGRGRWRKGAPELSKLRKVMRQQGARQGKQMDEVAIRKGSFHLRLKHVNPAEGMAVDEGSHLPVGKLTS